MNFFYRCSECKKTFDISPEIMLCTDCSKKQEPDRPLKGILEVIIEGMPESDLIFDLLPVEKKYFPAIPVGNTPLWEPEYLRAKYNLPGLYLKDETLNPTGSFKDRASYLVAAFARKNNIKNITVASTGNAASSMAGIGAASCLNVTIFIPESAPKAKMIQSMQYGAKIIPVHGTYDKAFDLSIEHTKKTGGLNRNTAYNPLTIEGKKTCSIEIFRQLGKIPDYIFLPVGDGVILGGIYKGFKDLLALNLTDKIPIIYGVQAQGSSAISRALIQGDFSNPVSSNTIADSISVDIPRNGFYAVKQLKKYNGKCITVSDREILSAQKELAGTTGLFSEPSSSASFAGFLKVRNNIPCDASVVLLLTGSGLKDIETAEKGLNLS